MTSVRFYHSVVCPRCQMAGLFLRQLLPEFPGIEITKIEFLTNAARAREEGVRSIPSLVSGERRLSGFLLTKGRIRKFLESLGDGAPATIRE